jgi:hypothetical protein
MVAVMVQMVRESKDLGRASLDAKAAPFALFRIHFDPTPVGLSIGCHAACLQNLIGTHFVVDAKLRPAAAEDGKLEDLQIAVDVGETDVAEPCSMLTKTPPGFNSPKISP